MGALRFLRVCALLCAAVSASTAAPARAADWIKVAETPDIYALDVAGATKLPGRKLLVWVRKVLVKPKELAGYSRPAVYTQERLSVDCDARTMEMLEWRFYDASGGEVDRNVLSPSQQVPGATDPKSIGYIVFNAACKYVHGTPPRSVPVDYRVRAAAAWSRINYVNATTSYFSEGEVRLGQGQGGDNVVSYPVRLDWDTPQAGPGYASAVMLYVTDCRNYSTMVTSTAWYDRNREFLFREDVDFDKLKLETPVHNTVGEAAAMRACAQRTALLKSPAAPAGKPPTVAAQPPAATPPQEKEGKPRVGSGTGWHVGNGLVVTAAHVVNEARSISVIGQDGERHAARVVQFDEKNDVAVLSVGEAARGWRAVALARAPAPLGSHVMTIGFPLLPELGDSPKVTSGEISSTRGMQDDPTVYQISAPIQPGNSGGPLFNMYGEVVGMVVFKLDEEYAIKELGTVPQNIGYAVKTRYIEVLLEEANRGALPARAGGRRELRAEELAGQNRDAVFIVLAVKPPKKERAAER